MKARQGSKLGDHRQRLAGILRHDLKMGVNERANPAACGLRLVQGNREVIQETIHDLAANTVKQFLFVADVMV
jgi:hypothetical protein